MSAQTEKQKSNGLDLHMRLANVETSIAVTEVSLNNISKSVERVCGDLSAIRDSIAKMGRLDVKLLLATAGFLVATFSANIAFVKVPLEKQIEESLRIARENERRIIAHQGTSPTSHHQGGK